MANLADSCTFTWNSRTLTLGDLESFTSLLVNLHDDVAVPYVTSEFYQVGPNVPGLPSVRVNSISMGSPLIIELLTGPSEVAVLALGMVGYVLRNPARLGEFIPRVREGWYRGNREALEQKSEYARTKGRVRAEGRPIETFEMELARSSREREIRNRRNRDDRGRRPR